MKEFWFKSFVIYEVNLNFFLSLYFLFFILKTKTLYNFQLGYKIAAVSVDIIHVRPE